jgi:AcrR family transcriptional regulator
LPSVSESLVTFLLDTYVAGMPVMRAPSRPTQSERRTATRRALLDATAACLIQQGYQGTTTTAVCERAGVSEGALFRHFPTKQTLLSVVAEHLYDRLDERFVHRFRQLDRGERTTPEGDTIRAKHARRVQRAVRLLWQVFESDELAASLELELAARTDASLRADLEPVIARHGERIRVLTAELFPDAVRDEHYERTIDLVFELMSGMAVSRMVDRSDPHYRRLLDHIVELATEALSSERARR